MDPPRTPAIASDTSSPSQPPAVGDDNELREPYVIRRSPTGLHAGSLVVSQSRRSHCDQSEPLTLSPDVVTSSTLVSDVDGRDSSPSRSAIPRPPRQVSQGLLNSVSPDLKIPNLRYPPGRLQTLRNSKLARSQFLLHHSESNSAGPGDQTVSSSHSLPPEAEDFGPFFPETPPLLPQRFPPPTPPLQTPSPSSTSFTSTSEHRSWNPQSFTPPFPLAAIQTPPSTSGSTADLDRVLRDADSPSCLVLNRSGGSFGAERRRSRSSQDLLTQLQDVIGPWQNRSNEISVFARSDAHSGGSSRAPSRADTRPTSPVTKGQAVLGHFGRQRGRRMAVCMPAGGPTLFAIFGLFVVAVFVTDLSFFAGLEEDAAPGWDGESKLEWLPPERSGQSYLEDEVSATLEENHPRVVGPMYDRLLALGAHTLGERQSEEEPRALWEEEKVEAKEWKPCSNRRPPGYPRPPGENATEGYIMLSAGGGLNQQRVAICNAVSVSRMLNATLVLPYLLYNGGSGDLSQFGDLFEVDHFISALAPDVRIVTEVPPVLQLLDLGALGNVVTDADIPKEALLPTFFHLLPLLRRHGAIHLFGFVNRVAADPAPFHLQVLIAHTDVSIQLCADDDVSSLIVGGCGVQRLRCRCHFHALRFTAPIRSTVQLLLGRMRGRGGGWGDEDDREDSDPKLPLSHHKGSGGGSGDLGRRLLDVKDGGSGEDVEEGGMVQTEVVGGRKGEGVGAVGVKKKVGLKRRRVWITTKMIAKARKKRRGAAVVGTSEEGLLGMGSVGGAGGAAWQLDWSERGMWVRDLGRREEGEGWAGWLAKEGGGGGGRARFVGLHMRFEIDMAAYSLCEFGGGVEEREELRLYRKTHFPTLAAYEEEGRLKPPQWFREEGLCPITPEEAALMLAALGYQRRTRIYMAGAGLWGGEGRMAMLRSLYPNLITKEALLSRRELAPFRESKSQLAAIDYLVCAEADMFVMTDVASQMAGLIAGHRIYWGQGSRPSIRPNKQRLSKVLEENGTIEWHDFEARVREAVYENAKRLTRPKSRSVYRHPRCEQCMCEGGEAVDKGDSVKDVSDWAAWVRTRGEGGEGPVVKGKGGGGLLRWTEGVKGRSLGRVGRGSVKAAKEVRREARHGDDSAGGLDGEGEEEVGGDEGILAGNGEAGGDREEDNETEVMDLSREEEGGDGGESGRNRRKMGKWKEQEEDRKEAGG